MSFWKGVGIVIVAMLLLLIIIPLAPIVGLTLLALIVALFNNLASLF